MIAAFSLREGVGAALLLAAVANCLTDSLLFALRKFKNAPGTLRAVATTQLVRNEAGRWRIPRATVSLQLGGDVASLLAPENHTFFGNDVQLQAQGWPTMPSCSPSLASQRATTALAMVLLPDPFGPTRPTFSPRKRLIEASRKRIWPPYCFEWPVWSTYRVTRLSCERWLPARAGSTWRCWS